jgi:hypothetical protein
VPQVELAKLQSSLEQFGTKQFAYMLSYSKVLTERLPDFYQYLLAYPNATPANVEDKFY